MMRTTRTFTTTMALAAALSVTGAAHAQQKGNDLGEKGQFILGADRLVSLLSWSRVSQDDFNGNGSTVVTQTSMSLFWSSYQIPGANGAPAALPNVGAGEMQKLFFTTPRIGFDYVVVPNLTIGGNIGVFFTFGSNASQNDNVSGMSLSGGNGNVVIFGIEPRAGYLLHLSDMWTLWLRGGVSFYTGTLSSGRQMDGTSQHFNADQFAVDLEPQIVFTPVHHFGITASINGDIPVVGRHSITGYNANGDSAGEESAPASALQVGLSLGMIGYF